MRRKSKRFSSQYRQRRVIIRSRSLDTDVAKIEELLAADYQDIWRNHLEDLEDLAEDIENNAKMLVPLDTGALRDSIMVRVSRSPRYPGIIAHASAIMDGFDYALIQEENEDYKHEETITYKDEYGRTVESIGDSGRMAHYLGGSFALFLSDYYESITGEELMLPAELEHAKDYILTNGGD